MCSCFTIVFYLSSIVANSLTPAATQALESSSLYTEDINPSLVPMDRTDKTDVHDFKDQLKSMGASKSYEIILLPSLVSSIKDKQVPLKWLW